MAYDHHTGDNMKATFFLNLGFTAIEVFGGLWVAVRRWLQLLPEVSSV